MDACAPEAQFKLGPAKVTLKLFSSKQKIKLTLLSKFKPDQLIYI